MTDAGGYAEARDVAGHEYTHAVFTAVVNPASNTGQTGAFNESYADIMGNLIERKPRSDSGCWQIGEDSDAGSVRTMAAPASYRQYAADGDVHANTAIFGYAADQMMNDSDTAAITERSFRPSRMASWAPLAAALAREC